MDPTDQEPAGADTTTITPPDSADVFSQFINEHGDYEDWSAATRQAYVNTVRHATGFGAL